MKRLFSILLFFIPLITNGTDYYIKNGGNDAAAGTSDGTAWETITKVNAEWDAGTFAPGDQILFKKGNTFYGMIIVKEGGSSGSPISIGAYGTGDAPIITGWTEVTGWTSYATGIWYKAITTQSTPNILLKDGVSTPFGRYPKNDYSVSDNITKTSITDSDFPVTPDYDGGEIVIRTTAWTIERKEVTHNGTDFIFSATVYPLSVPSSGWGFFIQNHINCLTQVDDWAYTSNTLYYYFGNGANPDDYEVKIATIDTLLNIVNCDYITVNDLYFDGVNKHAIAVDGSNIIIEDNKITNCGQSGIKDVWYKNNSYLYINRNIINTCNDIGIYLANDRTHYEIKNNEISNSGTIPGMGKSGDQSYSGIVARGDYGLISYNKVISAGYDGIAWGGQDSEVSYNYVDTTCFVKDDGGGIYTYRQYDKTNKVAKYNFVFNSLGAPYGKPTYSFGGHGLYNDGAYNITWEYNVSAYNSYIGMFVNPSSNVIVKNNTLFDNRQQIHMHYGSGSGSGNVVQNNICVAKRVIDGYSQSALAVVLIGGTDWSAYGVSDYNYYLRPINNDNYIDTWYNAYQPPYVHVAYNLAEWQVLSGQDANSVSPNITVSNTNDIHFLYNATADSKFYIVSAPMVDITETNYSGLIELIPWTSLILFGEGDIIGETVYKESGTVFAKDANGDFIKDTNGNFIKIIQ